MLCGQIAVLVIFLTIAAVSIFGFSKLELGLEISELAPVTSYMRRFDEVYAEYFNKFDQPTDIFFLPTLPAVREHPPQDRTADVDLLDPDEFLGRGPNSEISEQKQQQLQTPQWWKPEVQAALRLAHHRISSRPSTSRLINPLLAMLDDPEIGPKLRQGDKQASSLQRKPVLVPFGMVMNRQQHLPTKSIDELSKHALAMYQSRICTQSCAHAVHVYRFSWILSTTSLCRRALPIVSLRWTLCGVVLSSRHTACAYCQSIWHGQSRGRSGCNSFGKIATQ